jgi:hypothetical protein
MIFQKTNKGRAYRTAFSGGVRFPRLSARPHFLPQDALGGISGGAVCRWPYDPRGSPREGFKCEFEHNDQPPNTTF